IQKLLLVSPLVHAKEHALHFQVVSGRHASVEARPLDEAAYPGAYPAQLAAPAPEQLDLSRRGGGQTADHPQGSGLARSVPADKTVYRPLLYMHAHLVYCPVPAVLFCQCSCLQQQLTHMSHSFSLDLSYILRTFPYSFANKI